MAVPKLPFPMMPILFSDLLNMMYVLSAPVFVRRSRIPYSSFTSSNRSSFFTTFTLAPSFSVRVMAP